jgi:hypothetical protein
VTLRLVHLSDIHFGGEHRDAVGATAAWIARTRPDLAIITGDVTRDGSETEFLAARRWIRSLAVDSLVVPGNHDTPYFSLMKRLFAPWKRYERHFGPLPSTPLRRAGLAVASINTARGVQLRTNWSKGAISAPFVLPYPGGDGHTWAVGASTLSIRERDAPIGFNCIEVDEAIIRVTALAWTGSHFETWRTWSIDRRPLKA